MKKTKIIISILLLAQMYRVLAYSTAKAALTGSVAASWAFPAMADVAFGITAPLIVFMLWRKTGLDVWVVGVVWFALSIFDYIDGLTVGITVGPPVAKMSETYLISWFLSWILANIIALVLLTRKSMRSHYLQDEKSSTK